MYEEEAAAVAGYAKRLGELSKALRIESIKEQIADLETDMGAPTFWDDPDTANKVLQKMASLKSAVSAPEELRKKLEDDAVLIELAQAEADESFAQEIAEAVAADRQLFQQLEIRSLFADPRDAKDAIVSIHPGAGGTESCDWADILYRMMLRFCERQDFTVEIVDHQPGEEAGLKSATFTVSGPFAYGNLKSEAGVHRLVRISPFDSQSRRHTSFAAIEVLTPMADDIDIEIREEDIKMDVFRSSGAGGQKVNKTSSAVRLTHLPTGLVVACQIERSQHRNRDTAMELLKAKLYDIELRKREAELAGMREDQKDVAWGSQIRSYVLHPYQMIKDHRTNIETGNVDKVLDGDLTLFVEGYLKWKLGLQAEAAS